MRKDKLIKKLRESYWALDTSVIKLHTTGPAQVALQVEIGWTAREAKPPVDLDYLKGRIEQELDEWGPVGVIFEIEVT